MNTLEQAAAQMRKGGVIAYPTETVYGLGCDPDNRNAVMHLLELKQRPVEKGLILIATSEQQLHRYIEADVFAEFPYVSESWPGPNTWLIPCKSDTPVWLRGKFDTLAVRVIDHAVASKLCNLFGKPIVSTSANIAGRTPALDVTAIKQQFPSGLDYILEGPVGSTGNASIIRDAKTRKKIR